LGKLHGKDFSSDDQGIRAEQQFADCEEKPGQTELLL
ncbi:hypothetical protein EJB05_34573, partial [Eragrostis curvula]